MTIRDRLRETREATETLREMIITLRHEIIGEGDGNWPNVEDAYQNVTLMCDNMNLAVLSGMEYPDEPWQPRQDGNPLAKKPAVVPKKKARK